MQNNFFTILALTCLLVWGAGCVTTEKGDLKFGVPGKDTIVSRYEAPYDKVKTAAIAVLKRNGINPVLWPRNAGSYPGYAFTDAPLNLAAGHFGLGHGSGAHAPDEYYVIDSANPNVQG